MRVTYCMHMEFNHGCTGDTSDARHQQKMPFLGLVYATLKEFKNTKTIIGHFGFVFKKTLEGKSHLS